MKKIWIIVITAIALFTAGQVFASKVTNVELSCADGATLASINIDGAFRFTHQTEEAKDGKPFRIIVDVLSARHGLGAYTFTELPVCPVVDIRSSQYSVTPEEVVRIVFDMDNERVYRVEADNNKITIVIPDKATPKFSAWSTTSFLSAKGTPSQPVAANLKSTQPVVVTAPQKEKSAQELNKSIDDDRLVSLQSDSKSTADVKPPVKVETKPAPAVAQKPPTVVEVKPAAKQETVANTPVKTMTRVSNSGVSYGPVYAPPVGTNEKPSVVVAQAEKPTTPPKAVDKPAPKKAPEPQKTEPAKAVGTSAKTEQLAAVEPSAPKNEKKPVVNTKPVVSSKAEPEKPAPAVKKNETTNVEKNQPKVAAKEADSADKKSATSRFRRSPTESKKIKGTLVAEFPKRLVIKYKTSGWRDPFNTLIDDTKTDNNPVERRVPNVEGLKLVGIIEAGPKSNRALFEDKDGYGYILQTGDKVQKGYVLRVESDRVYFQIFEYGWSRTVALNLES